LKISASIYTLHSLYYVGKATRIDCILVLTIIPFYICPNVKGEMGGDILQYAICLLVPIMWPRHGSGFSSSTLHPLALSADICFISDPLYLRTRFYTAVSHAAIISILSFATPPLKWRATKQLRAFELCRTLWYTRMRPGIRLLLAVIPRLIRQPLDWPLLCPSSFTSSPQSHCPQALSFLQVLIRLFLFKPAFAPIKTPPTHPNISLFPKLNRPVSFFLY